MAIRTWEGSGEAEAQAEPRRRHRARKFLTLAGFVALAYGVYWAWSQPFAEPYVEKAVAFVKWAGDKAVSLIDRMLG